MKKKSDWNILFWDLDGTITDPRRGIIGAYQETLKEYGQSPIPESELLWVIGPPLRKCLETLLKTDHKEQIEEAVSCYRKWYVTNGLMYQDTPYPGIQALLEDVKGSGYRMFIATAKAHSYARKILEHWHLDHYFEDICGSELDGTRAQKGELLSWMLEQKNLYPANHILMIGDRHHDILAAQHNHITSLGVGYGYGSAEELQSAGANYYCSTVIELRQALLQS